MTVFARPDTACGTAACLAGTEMLLEGYGFEYSVCAPNFFRPDGTPVEDEAAEAVMLLDLIDDEYYGGDEEPATLFGVQDEDHAIERLRLLVEAAEAREAAGARG